MVPTGSDEPSGHAFVSWILNELCNKPWPVRVVAKMSAVLRDVNLGPPELSMVVAKVIRTLRDLDTQDVPAVVYQVGAEIE